MHSLQFNLVCKPFLNKFTPYNQQPTIAIDRHTVVNAATSIDLAHEDVFGGAVAGSGYPVAVAVAVAGSGYPVAVAVADIR